MALFSSQALFCPFETQENSLNPPSKIFPKISHLKLCPLHIVMDIKSHKLLTRIKRYGGEVSFGISGCTKKIWRFKISESSPRKVLAKKFGQINILKYNNYVHFYTDGHFNRKVYIVTFYNIGKE